MDPYFSTKHFLFVYLLPDCVTLPVELFYGSKVSPTHYFYSKNWIHIIYVNWLSITRPLQFPPRTNKQKVFNNIYLNK